ncbi:MAG TPA: SIMPL domain-containing protein [Anaerolineaceae bacterium]|nr:SIMPL domain-containing protein [Anaerolineaceae bacterium]HPN53443.1 SIMPL domain-containing protein [Anaerolineaceae bacterium]
MRNKLMILIALLVSLSLMLGACSALPQADKKNENIRNISVNGTGKVYITPDLAYINIGVHTENKEVSGALTANTAQAQQVAAALAEMGVDPKDIQTSNFNIYPMQEYGPQGEMIGTKYVVENTVYVTVRDLAKLGAILDKVVSVGANTINSISFDVTDKTKALSEARKLAIQDARTQADEIAAAAGVSLGDLMNVSVYINDAPMSMYDAKGGNMSANSSVPISAGQLIIQANASLMYEIK